MYDREGLFLPALTDPMAVLVLMSPGGFLKGEASW
jgi:hypothetical protein